MKNRFNILIIIFCILILGSSYLYAATATMNVYTKKVSDNSSDTQITWSGISSTTDWKCANQYLEIHYKCDYAGWGVQIFTNNTISGATYRYTRTYGETHVGDPNRDPNTAPNVNTVAGDFAAGLVHQAGKYTLPMCWRITAPRAGDDRLTTSERTIVEREDANGVKHLTMNDQPLYYCWIFMKDKGNDGWSDPVEYFGQLIPNPDIKWTNGGDYESIMYDPGGIQHAEMSFDGWGLGMRLDGQTDGLYGVLVYLGANFKYAGGGDYKTKIYVEMYHY